MCLSSVGATSAQLGEIKLKSRLGIIGSDIFFLSLAALSDPAAKENCMMHLLRSLPDPNLMTFLTLLEHLKRYAHTKLAEHMNTFTASHSHPEAALTPSSLTDGAVGVCSCRVAEKEPINKMSLHNLATVFGPTLLRPSESEVAKGQHITSASDIWSHDVMAQVPTQGVCLSFTEL